MMNQQQQQQQPPPPAPQYQLDQGQGQGVYVQPPPAYNYPPGVQRPVAKKFDPTEILNIVIRIVALATTFLATVLTGVAREVDTNKTDKLSSISPIKYFVAANSMVLIYSFATLVISIFSILTKNQNQQGSTETLRNKLIMLFVIGDLVAVVFLFSAVGSSAGTRVLFHSESDFNENFKFCDVEDYYYSSHRVQRTVLCAQWIAGIVLSMIGAVAYFVLELLSVLSLAKVKSGKS